ncbi:hypothetical protein [Fulvivirga ligni]|uniref:hypothetical protein n=1 Tax=Fulvivirga ligni TaxID=2904246 RepID=UPI001F248CA5|nr:hypothetical protein [Fulvivirga ligni]UII19171.1 hypothetical protein LVD16_15100 [Fulvivirga ligni]
MKTLSTRIKNLYNPFIYSSHGLQKMLLTSAITILMLTAMSISSEAQMRIKRYANLGNEVDYNTGFDANAWEAGVIGFQILSADVQENNTGDFLKVFMYVKNEEWHLKANLRSHKNHETWYADVIFIPKGMANFDSKFGVGTNSPEQRLHVNGNILMAANHNLMTKGHLNIHANIEGADDGGDIRFKSFDQVHMLMKENGNFGIGIMQPSEKLHVNGNIRVADNSSIFGLNKLEGYQGLMFSASDDSGVNMVISEDGDVGIGTAVPNAKLHVNGDIFVENGHHLMSNGAINFTADSANNNKNIFMFKTGNQNLMSITKEGNLGVGTTNVAHKLHVNGDAYATSFVTSAASFPDYVFEENYEVMSLSDMEQFVKSYHHLPNMPSEQEVVTNGLSLNTVAIQSVENIETIYLHLIRLEKELQSLKEENKELQKALSQIK